MSVNYRPDHQGTGAGMRSSDMDDIVKRVAEEGKRFAESIAPVQTGRYRGAFRVETGHENVAGETRSVARLVNDVDYAADVEADVHVLGRTIDHLDNL